MDEYKVLYRTTGLLTGKEPGDVVELDSVDAKHLLDLGIVEKVKPPKKAEPTEDDKKPAPKPAARKPAAKEAE